MNKDEKYLTLIAEVNKVRTLQKQTYQDIARQLGYSARTIGSFMACNPRNTSIPIAQALQKYVNNYYNR